MVVINSVTALPQIEIAAQQIERPHKPQTAAIETLSLTLAGVFGLGDK